MLNRFVRAAVALSALLVATGCPQPLDCEKTPDDPKCEPDASLPPDFCNSQQEALSDSANCHLTVEKVTTALAGQRKGDVFISTLADGGVDKDWYFAQMPGTLTQRSLLHINAGYQAPQTAVNFSVNVLGDGPDGGLTSVVTGVDRHGAAAPKPVDLIIPFSQQNAKLYVLVGDEGVGPALRVDNRNAYSVLVEVLENPDQNEPNDTTATAIPLAAGPNNSQTGTNNSGFLGTNDDVDLYSFQVTGGGRQIIYLRIQGIYTALTPPMHPTNPPPPFRVSYTLYDPTDNPISEGVMENEFLPIDLSTARLAPMTGTYKVKIQGFKPPNTMTVVKGDLRINYGIEVRILPDIDSQEPNDTVAMARPLNLAPNSTMNLTGKLSYVPDEEWFQISLPARGSPSTLRYRVRVANSGGRFDPLAPVATRQIRFATKVTTGATTQDRQNACITNATVCPKGFASNDPNQIALVEAVCRASDPPQCLYANRNEEPAFDNLKNLVGAIPIMANQATELFMMFRDEGRGRAKYADDRDWTIELRWQDDADEASRLGGPTQITLGGSATTAQGELTFGYGKILEPFDVNTGDGIRGPQDYDAYDTDKDLFQFNFGGAAGDQTWRVDWDLMHPDGGSEPPGDITLELTFCGSGGTGDGGLCPGEQRRIFAFNSDRITPWYLPQSFANAQVLFSRTSSGGMTTISALPVGCWCFSGARTASGRFYANIAAINRTANDPIVYRIRQSIGPYPSSYSSADGGGGTCPVPDGGCGFAQ